MDVFTTHLAFALEEEAGIKVFSAGDPDIEDTGLCMEIAVTPFCQIDCAVLSNEGLEVSRNEARRIADTLRHKTLEVSPGLHIGPMTPVGSMRRIKGDAPYADRAEMTLTFDIETSYGA